MSPNLALYATDLRRAASDPEGLTEADKVLLGCLVIAHSLSDIRHILGPAGPASSPDVHVIAAIMRASKNIGLDISGAANTILHGLE